MVRSFDYDMSFRPRRQGMFRQGVFLKIASGAFSDEIPMSDRFQKHIAISCLNTVNSLDVNIRWKLGLVCFCSGE